jgi:hypothetical protein
MLSWPHLAAGPVGERLARTMVGSIEPQPDSTITTPRISPLDLGTTTLKEKQRGVICGGQRWKAEALSRSTILSAKSHEAALSERGQGCQFAQCQSLQCQSMLPLKLLCLPPRTTLVGQFSLKYWVIHNNATLPQKARAETNIIESHIIRATASSSASVSAATNLFHFRAIA